MRPRSVTAAVVLAVAAAAAAVVVVLQAGGDDGPPAAGQGEERYLGAWTGPDGQPASTGVGFDEVSQLVTRRLPDHCDWQEALALHLAWPLGSTVTTGDREAIQRLRRYVRDPQGVLPADAWELEHTFDPDAVLPPGSRDTGYRLDDVELWLGPDDGEDAAYLVTAARTERWPRAETRIGCA